MAARGLNQRDDVAAHGRIDVDRPHLFGQPRHCVTGEHGPNLLDGMATTQRHQHRLFLGCREITKLYAKEKAVELRLGQGKGALELDRVLRCQHEEWAQQDARLAVDRNLALAHTLKQGGLGAWGGAVDLVGEQDVGERRAGHELEAPRLLVEDADAGNVAGQQVGRTLNAPEVAAETQRQRARQHRLAHAGHILQQHVAFAQQRNEQRVDDLLFADDDFLDVGAKGFCKLLDFGAHAHHRFCGRRRWAHRFMASVCPRTQNLSARRCSVRCTGAHPIPPIPLTQMPACAMVSAIHARVAQ